MSPAIALNELGGYYPAGNGPERASVGLQGQCMGSKSATKTDFSGPAGAVAAPARPQYEVGTRVRRCRVLLFRGRGLISAAIRWQTRSEYSHAALLMPDGRILESWQGAGVRVKEITDWTDVDRFTVPALTDTGWGKVLDFAWAQIGSGYDYTGVLRFVSRRKSPENNRWFCSELVFAALVQTGLPILARIDAAEVSPALLALSPHLYKETA